jgi:N12 class adenine-specific DNA methylase
LLEKEYNRKFRGFVDKEFSTDPIEIPGLANQEKIKPHIWSGLKWALDAQRGILADDVGLGKTVQGLMLAKMMRLTGRAKRPMIVVPKAVLANWYAEVEKWFPGSRVLTIGGSVSRDANGEMVGKDDTAADRERKFQDLQQNEYDFILVSEPAFETVDLDPITKGEYESEDFWSQRDKAFGNKGTKQQVKIQTQAEQARRSADYRASLRTGSAFFDELGVDGLIYDEAHHCKTLAIAKQRFGETPRFLGSGNEPSARALDLNIKSRWLLRNNDNRNVYLLTATPTKNSPLNCGSWATSPSFTTRTGVSYVQAYQ